MDLNSPEGMFKRKQLYIVISKLLMQKAWLGAATWEDLLPEHHQQEWINVSVNENEVPTEKNSTCASIFARKASYLSN